MCENRQHSLLIEIFRLQLMQLKIKTSIVCFLLVFLQYVRRILFYLNLIQNLEPANFFNADVRFDVTVGIQTFSLYSRIYILSNKESVSRIKFQTSISTNRNVFTYTITFMRRYYIIFYIRIYISSCGYFPCNQSIEYRAVNLCLPAPI